VTPPNCTITTSHVDPFSACSAKWSKDASHTSMVEISKHSAARSFVSHMFEASGREIGKQNMCLA